MSQQIALFKGSRGAEYDDLAPFRDAYFPEEYRLGLEALFRADVHLAATGRLKSDTRCPYRVGRDLYSAPLESRQLRLFGDYEPTPLMLLCDCPRARSLLEDVGQRLPHCSKNRCPVRFLVLSDA